MEEAADKGETSDSIENTVPPKSNTGRTFRDGIRKIDLILVVQDEENVVTDTMKNKFITNIVKTGFEIEFENGVLPNHRKLVFFKVHCPNDVLNNLGNAFGIKCVQSGRAEHIMSNKERDWINVLRKEYIQPLQYSSLERSLVVYMALLNLPFGERQNFIGLERLMKLNIVIDAYALHDGPYFIPPDASSINARQILFYNWTGISNIFTRQPLNVVHEYFGPKIALYFAYYGLYNLFLTIASIAALTTFLLSIYRNENYMDRREELCYVTKEGVCFDCVQLLPTRFGCEYIPFNHFCNWQTMNYLIDNKYAPFFATFIILWGFFFTSYWFGRERFLNWVWKAYNRDFSRKQMRPEFEANVGEARKSNLTGIVIIKNHGHILMIMLCYIGIIFLHVFIFVLFITREKIRELGPGGLISRLSYTTIAFAVILSVIDHIHKKTANYIVRMENHKTYESFSRSLILHLYVMCFCLPMVAVTYFGFQKAVFEFLLWRGYKFEDTFLFVETCLMTSCINELTIVFTITLLLTFGIFKKLTLYSSVTDYNQRAIVQNVPCWEREYVLPPFTETILANKMKILVVQFTLIIAFGYASPPAIFLAMLFNILDIRRDAQLCTLHYRRPLLLKNKAFNIWSDILKSMVYLAIIANVVTFICSTDTVERYLIEHRRPTGNTFNHYIGLHFHRHEMNLWCNNRAYLHIAQDYTPKREDLTIDELKTYQYMYIFFFEIIMAAIYLMVQKLFTIDVGDKELPKRRKVADSEETEMNNVGKTNSAP